MYMKTIALPEEVYKKLIGLKIEQGNKTAAELIDKLIIEYKKKRLEEFGKEFRKSLKEKDITFKQLLKESRKIREEIADEWFPD